MLDVALRWLRGADERRASSGPPSASGRDRARAENHAREQHRPRTSTARDAISSHFVAWAKMNAFKRKLTFYEGEKGRKREMGNDNNRRSGRPSEILLFPFGKYKWHLTC